MHLQCVHSLFDNACALRSDVLSNAHSISALSKAQAAAASEAVARAHYALTAALAPLPWQTAHGRAQMPVIGYAALLPFSMPMPARALGMHTMSTSSIPLGIHQESIRGDPDPSGFQAAMALPPPLVEITATPAIQPPPAPPPASAIHAPEIGTTGFRSTRSKNVDGAVEALLSLNLVRSGDIETPESEPKRGRKWSSESAPGEEQPEAKRTTASDRAARFAAKNGADGVLEGLTTTTRKARNALLIQQEPARDSDDIREAKNDACTPGAPAHLPAPMDAPSDEHLWALSLSDLRSAFSRLYGRHSTSKNKEWLIRRIQEVSFKRAADDDTEPADGGNAGTHDGTTICCGHEDVAMVDDDGEDVGN
jgi:hypothetical protein